MAPKTRPTWELEEVKDLELLLRIAGEPTYERSFYEDELDETEASALLRLRKYGLTRRGPLRTEAVPGSKRQEYRVIETYRLTRKGKRAYIDVLEGLEKHMPYVEE